MGYQPSSDSFVKRIEDAMKFYADECCVQFQGEMHTYADVERISSNIAAYLARNGFNKGDHAAIYSFNSAQVLIATLGILRAGGVWMPIDPRNAERENVRTLSTYECRAVFYQDAFSNAVEEVNHKSGNVCLSINIDQTSVYDIPVNEFDSSGVDIASDDLISLPMTGGTTGQPKSVMLSNANFNALAYGLGQWYKDYESLPVILCVAPMTHVGGRIALSAMISGARMIVQEKFNARDILKTVQSEKVTDLFLPPTAIYALLEEPFLQQCDHRSLKNFLYGSAPISLEKLKQCLRIFGPVMRGAYGQTESPLFVTEMTPADHFVDGELAPDEKLHSVGHATELSELVILDERGEVAPPGEVGEVAVRGPMVFMGYYKNDAETDKVRSNGWHLMGDIARMDEDGFVYLMDRKKDMIITGGFNVYSSEVEQVINQIPGVLVSQVIGVPSERWGEEVKALVQRDAESDLSEKQISEICREQLGGVKTPKTIEFRDVFPLTSLGKIDKRALREAYWTEKHKL